MKIDRLAVAEKYYNSCMEAMKNKPEPDGQKFPIGCRVRIADDLGPEMSHFFSGVNATVEYTCAHAFDNGSPNAHMKYSLNIAGVGSVSWYREDQLTPIEEIVDNV